MVMLVCVCRVVLNQQNRKKGIVVETHGCGFGCMRYRWGGVLLWIREDGLCVLSDIHVA